MVHYVQPLATTTFYPLQPDDSGYAVQSCPPLPATIAFLTRGWCLPPPPPPLCLLLQLTMLGGACGSIWWVRWYSWGLRGWAAQPARMGSSCSPESNHAGAGNPIGCWRPLPVLWRLCAADVAAAAPCAACFCLLQLTTIPFDWIVLGCLGLQDSNNSLAWWGGAGGGWWGTYGCVV